jgi:hypothetical protein
MDHIVGARFAVPAVLYSTFEAWHAGSVANNNTQPQRPVTAVTVKAARVDKESQIQLQRSFAAVFVQVARGDSLRCETGRLCNACTRHA